MARWRKPAGPEPSAPAPDPLERERIAAQERAKIFRDLHDDIGVKLLALLHTVNDVRQADLVRSVIYDLRDIVSRSRRPPGTLLEVLAQIRDEMEQRLEALGAHLAWKQDSATPDVAITGPAALNLFRIMREAVTNAIRHGQAREIRVSIQCQEGVMTFEIANDGGGAIRASQAGTGTLGMRERAASLGGSLQLSAELAGGVKVTLQVPLQALESAA
jgi:signal transduction histidine kinase